MIWSIFFLNEFHLNSPFCRLRDPLVVGNPSSSDFVGRTNKQGLRPVSKMLSFRSSVYVPLFYL